MITIEFRGYSDDTVTRKKRPDKATRRRRWRAHVAHDPPPACPCGKGEPLTQDAAEAMARQAARQRVAVPCALQPTVWHLVGSLAFLEGLPF